MDKVKNYKGRKANSKAEQSSAKPKDIETDVCVEGRLSTTLPTLFNSIPTRCLSPRASLFYWASLTCYVNKP